MKSLALPYLDHSHLAAALVVSAGLWLLPGSSLGQAAPGDSTPDLGFAAFDSTGALEGRSTMADFQNKVLILYYYTPW